jgi:hypothetical protein
MRSDPKRLTVENPMVGYSKFYIIDAIICTETP